MRISAKILAMIAVLALICVAPAIWSGCGPSAPAFDPQTDYTPESLAGELAFRYRDLPENGKKISSRPVKKAEPLKGKALEKSGEATKEPATNSPDTIFEDLALKIRQSKKLSPADFCKQMIEAVKKNESLKPEERDALVKRLEQLTGEL